LPYPYKCTKGSAKLWKLDQSEPRQSAELIHKDVHAKKIIFEPIFSWRGAAPINQISKAGCI
jgi:hypothetical protein